MRARYLSLAEQEMIQAARYYEVQVPGLGYDFLSEINRVVKSIEGRPEAAPIIKGIIRRRIIAEWGQALHFTSANPVSCQM